MSSGQRAESDGPTDRPADGREWLAHGCGRCAHFRTPSCKVHRWAPILVGLRDVLLSTGMDEAIKWGSPCYVWEGRNVAMLVAFRERCGVSLLQGSLLEDPEGRLVPPGPHSHHARLFLVPTEASLPASLPALRGFLAQAMQLAAEGGRDRRPVEREDMPAELAEFLARDSVVQAAYDALTPGRKRSYILHIAGAKKSETRQARAERCKARILAGKGFHER